MCTRFCMWVCAYKYRLETRGTRFPEVEVKGVCKMPDMDVGKQTQVLCKSRICFWPFSPNLSHA